MINTEGRGSWWGNKCLTDALYFQLIEVWGFCWSLQSSLSTVILWISIHWSLHGTVTCSAQRSSEDGPLHFDLKAYSIGYLDYYGFSDPCWPYSRSSSRKRTSLCTIFRDEIVLIRCTVLLRFVPMLDPIHNIEIEVLDCSRCCFFDIIWLSLNVTRRGMSKSCICFDRAYTPRTDSDDLVVELEQREDLILTCTLLRSVTISWANEWFRIDT